MNKRHKNKLEKAMWRKINQDKFNWTKLNIYEITRFWCDF